MTTEQKVSGLNNIENIYDEAVALLDGISHAERYYTKAECNSKYFTSVNDGEGSSLVCERLAGRTAEEIINAGIPPKCIGIWSGSEDSIPPGWYLCNGLNGTPYLIGRIPVCAGGSFEIGAMGGSWSQTVAASAVNIATHALTADELPPHTHGYTDDYRNSSSGSYNSSGKGAAVDHPGLLTNLESSTPHGHDGSTFSGSEFSIVPPSMALCYIMNGEI